MTLATGAKLGPYEVVSTLGAGGMGEVYRARDARSTSCDRSVTVPAAIPGILPAMSYVQTAPAPAST
jgi:serine/threonine protein kinase